MKLSILVSVLIIISAGNLLADPPVKTDSDKANWQKQMQLAKHVLTDFMPLIVSEEAFNSSKNAQRIETNLDQLLSVAHIIAHAKEKTVVNADPTVEFVAGYFESNLKSAKASLRKGRRDHARFLLLNTSSYCIECHTRTQSGPNFAGLSLSQNLSLLNPVEQIEYLISVRQFDEALKLIEGSLAKDSQLPMFGAEKIIRYGLAVTVKYLNNPEAALRILNLPGSAKSLPHYVRNDLKQWKKSTEKWKAEQKKTAALSIPATVKKAEALIAEATQLNLRTSSPNAGHIEILRANALLTASFQKSPTKDQTARMLFLTGETYKLIPDHLFWTLHETFFASCISQTPHTKQAEECYKAYEESVILGYSGSSGTFIPADVMKEMTELRNLSEIKAKSDQIK